MLRGVVVVVGGGMLGMVMWEGEVMMWWGTGVVVAGRDSKVVSESESSAE